MQVTFVEFQAENEDALVDFITSEPWDYFETPSPTVDSVRRWIQNGHFSGETSKTFWGVAEDGEKVAVVTAFDLTDPIPRVELRVLSRYRRQGIGRQALLWLADYVFQNYSHVLRLEGNTRIDNAPMRKTFLASGWVKEAHYRNLWKTATGEYVDTIGYAVIRQDWEAGTITPVRWDS